MTLLLQWLGHLHIQIIRQVDTFRLLRLGLLWQGIFHSRRKLNRIHKMYREQISSFVSTAHKALPNPVKINLVYQLMIINVVTTYNAHYLNRQISARFRSDVSMALEKTRTTATFNYLYKIICTFNKQCQQWRTI